MSSRRIKAPRFIVDSPAHHDGIFDFDFDFDGAGVCQKPSFASTSTVRSELTLKAAAFGASVLGSPKAWI